MAVDVPGAGTCRRGGAHGQAVLGSSSQHSPGRSCCLAPCAAPGRGRFSRKSCTARFSRGPREGCRRTGVWGQSAGKWDGLDGKGAHGAGRAGAGASAGSDPAPSFLSASLTCCPAHVALCACALGTGTGNAEGRVPVTQHRATSSSPLLWMRSGRFPLPNPFVPILIPLSPATSLARWGSSLVMEAPGSSQHRATFPHACHHHILGAARTASTRTGSEIKAGFSPRAGCALCDSNRSKK